VFRIALFEPEIPPNTGNIIRLCANTGCALHLIEPLGFELDDKRLRRAGLDYSEWASVQTHSSWPAFRGSVEDSRIFAATTHGQRNYAEVDYLPTDTILLGPETRGLPKDILEELGMEHCLRIPMRQHSRSLNLSNAAAVILYEAWRQQQFAT
jgi:tRNA (cytidine/uridine-2'-O-)-methyltransferase